MIRRRGGITQRNGTVVVKIKPVKAKHPANQEAVDRLNEQRIQAEKNPNSNYVFTVKRALKSLAECPTPITTLAEANALKYVGPRIAQVILPDGGVQSPPAARAALAKKKKAPPPVAAGGLKQQRLTSTTSTTATKRKTTTTTTTAARKEPGPSNKQRNYYHAKRHAENLKLSNMADPWKVILLIDIREAKSEHVVSKCRQSGIPCEERHLPIGDMAWIARCEHKNGTATEVMCGTVIERKFVSDLASSLFGTRYAEQRLRLQNSGLPQVLFLVEGNLNHCNNCPADSLHMAMIETRVQLDFQILHTQHLDGTVRLLKGLHRRVVQRAFPDAFSSDLPTFASPQEATRSRKRRRVTSLLEMVFDTPPVPAFGAKRFITYEELKAKVFLDREAGTKSVKAIYMAMLKQVATLSQKKCEAIAREYPTMNSLMTAYAESSDKRRLVQDIVCDRQRVGPRSAAELYVACCTQRDGKVLGHQYLSSTSTASSTTASTNNNNYAWMPPSLEEARQLAATLQTASVSTTATTTTTKTAPKEIPRVPSNNPYRPANRPAAGIPSAAAVAKATSTARKTAPKEVAPTARPPSLPPKNTYAPARRPPAATTNVAPIECCVDLTADTPEKPKPNVATRNTSPISVTCQSPEYSLSQTTMTTIEDKKPAARTLQLSQLSSSSEDASFQSPESNVVGASNLSLSQSSLASTKRKTPVVKKAFLSTNLLQFSASSGDTVFQSGRKRAPASQRQAAVPTFSQTSTSSADSWVPSQQQGTSLPARTPAQPAVSAARKTKTPASGSSSSYGCYTSPDPTPVVKKSPARMVSLEDDSSVTSSKLSTQCSTKGISVRLDAARATTSNSLFLAASRASSKPRPAASKENVAVDLLSMLDDSDDDDGGDLDGLKTRLARRYKPEVIEID